MQQRDRENANYKTLLEFVKDDYKLKTEYLVKHFERLWTRFTFLITFETALIGVFAGALEFEANYLTLASSAVGLIISVYWIFVSRDDNRLYKWYRDHHVKRAFGVAKSLLGGMPAGETSCSLLDNYSYAGDTTGAPRRRRVTSIMIMPIALAIIFSIVWAILLAASLFAPASLQLRPIPSQQHIISQTYLLNRFDRFAKVVRTDKRPKRAQQPVLLFPSAPGSAPNGHSAPFR